MKLVPCIFNFLPCFSKKVRPRISRTVIFIHRNRAGCPRQAKGQPFVVHVTFSPVLKLYWLKGYGCDIKISGIMVFCLLKIAYLWDCYQAQRFECKEVLIKKNKGHENEF